MPERIEKQLGISCEEYNKKLTAEVIEELAALLETGNNFAALKLLFKKGFSEQGQKGVLGRLFKKLPEQDKIELSYKLGFIPKEVLNAITNILEIITFEDLKNIGENKELTGKRSKIDRHQKIAEAFGELLILTVFDNLEFYIKEGEYYKKIGFWRDGKFKAEKLSIEDIQNNPKIYENIINILNNKSSELKNVGGLIISKQPVEGEGADFAVKLFDGCIVAGDNINEAYKIDPYLEWIVLAMINLKDKFLKEMYKSKSYIDKLTGLHRRDLFDSIDFSNKGGFFVMMDMDHFKSVNDTYGHPTGDSVLKQLAKLIQSSFRDEDLSFRYGGEEFVVWLKCNTLEEALNIVERFRKIVELHDFDLRDEQGKIVYKTISIGLAENKGEKPLERADELLYKSKHDGRNRITVAE